MSKKSSILLVLGLVLIFLIFFAPQAAWRLRAVFMPPAYPDTSNLEQENLVLKAELAKLQNIKSQLPEKPRNYIRAIVLSRYPLNFQNEFLVDAGKAQGIAEGRAVIFGDNLIGRIAKVFQDTSLVETVLDSDFQTAARIGYWAADALFKGGLTPKLSLIPLNARIKEGDVVFSASPDFPYSLPIGKIKEISSSGDKLFQEATLEFAYDMNEIRNVFISGL